MFLSLVSLLLVAQTPVVIAKHPSKPQAISEHLGVDCAKMRLELIRYRARGNALPLPELKIDGQVIEMPWRLRDDLMTPGAIYKFGPLCSPDDAGFQIDIWEISRRQGEDARYRWGRLTVSPKGRFVWRGLHPVSADKFWFS
jgi:hypothetical protein